jgi:hypothetical protein
MGIDIMAENKVVCANCGNSVPKDWTFEVTGGIICEDCYMDKEQTVKACDPLAVHSAKTVRELTGQKGAEGLSELQKQIFDLVKSKGQVEYDELIQTFKLSDKDLENQIAILRHCELVKGKKIEDKTYLVPF